MSIYEGKRKFQASEEQMVNFFVEHCKKYGTIKSGTYNPADPTHYEKIKVQFLTDNYENKLDVEIEDISWFVKIEFSEYGSKLASGMWDPEQKCFLNVSLNGEAFFDLLHKVLFNSNHQSDLDLIDGLSEMGYYEE